LPLSPSATLDGQKPPEHACITEIDLRFWVDTFSRWVGLHDPLSILLHGAEDPADAAPHELQCLDGVEADFVVPLGGELKEAA
jgi:hypothetical protein